MGDVCIGCVWIHSCTLSASSWIAGTLAATLPPATLLASPDSPWANSLNWLPTCRQVLRLQDLLAVLRDRALRDFILSHRPLGLGCQLLQKRVSLTDSGRQLWRQAAKVLLQRLDVVPGKDLDSQIQASTDRATRAQHRCKRRCFVNFVIFKLDEQVAGDACSTRIHICMRIKPAKSIALAVSATMLSPALQKQLTVTGTYEPPSLWGRRCELLAAVGYLQCHRQELVKDRHELLDKVRTQLPQGLQRGF